MTKNKPHGSTNGSRQSYMRNDYWAQGSTGYFGWLWETYKSSPAKIAQLDRISQAAKSPTVSPKNV